MAATLQSSRNDNDAVIYPTRALMTEFDFQDDRYPSISTSSRSAQRTSMLIFGAGLGESSTRGKDSPPRTNYDIRDAVVWGTEQSSNQDILNLQQPQSRTSATSADLQAHSRQLQLLEPHRNSLSYALPQVGSRRVVERYSLDDNSQRAPSRASANAVPVTAQDTRNTVRGTANLQASLSPATQSSTLPLSDMGGRSNNDYSIMPLSASPSYNPPVAPKHRAYAQQPTYITPPTTPVPVKTIYSPRPPAYQEEVCVECAMRDEDMADVDVTSPGVWERESDAAFEELRRREAKDEENGIVIVDDPTRPRIKGGRLTEQNIRIWLSINPREPTARQQTLRAYVKSQRNMVEAEAFAHARAMQEAKQLDSKMRDTFSQLRRSAYDLGNSSSPSDDLGGVRIRPPQSPSAPMHNSHARSHSREVTLLENGMIVEHVDVRREEREARERKKKEERRARKSSRGSTMDVTSIMSTNSMGTPQTDGGFGLRSTSPYSPNSARPTSVLTAPVGRPDLPVSYSQASFSDFHSLGTTSPRRTRFFGFRNLSAGWRSQDSLAASRIESSSMVDMHLALQGERHSPKFVNSPSEYGIGRRSQIWPPDQADMTGRTVEGNSKKKKGLAKIWGMVTGSNKHANIEHRDTNHSLEKEDNFTLAPPPPMSYLVGRGPSEMRVISRRADSSPSLPSLISPKLAGSTSAQSPSTGPSSVFPSPASSARAFGPDVEIVDPKRTSAVEEMLDGDYRDETIGRNGNQLTVPKNVHPVTSEPDIRLRVSRNISPPLVSSALRPPPMTSREKSLPPLPIEAGSRPPNSNMMEPRPRTVYTYDPRQLPPGSSPAHDFLPSSTPFRTVDVRRQSFGGMSSRPTNINQTMPINGRQNNPGFSSRYDDFGFSMRSLGPLDALGDGPIPSVPPKKKSKFSFASLLGRKSAEREADSNNVGGSHLFPSMQRTGSDGQDDYTVNGYAASTSRHSALSIGAPPTRLSVTSRKALEERVAQDPEFVAYRYPSGDQRLDLLR